MVGTRSLPDDVARLDFAEVDDAQAHELLAALTAAFCRAANGGDVEDYLRLCAPDIYFQSATARADGTSYRGYDGMRAYFAQVREVFSDMDIELLELERVAPNRFRIRNRWRARGRGSGAMLETEMRSDVTWEPGGGMVRLVATTDPEDDLRTDSA